MILGIGEKVLEPSACVLGIEVGTGAASDFKPSQAGVRKYYHFTNLFHFPNSALLKRKVPRRRISDCLYLKSLMG